MQSRETVCFFFCLVDKQISLKHVDKRFVRELSTAYMPCTWLRGFFYLLGMAIYLGQISESVSRLRLTNLKCGMIVIKKSFSM